MPVVRPHRVEQASWSWHFLVMKYEPEEDVRGTERATQNRSVINRLQLLRNPPAVAMTGYGNSMMSRVLKIDSSILLGVVCVGLSR